MIFPIGVPAGATRSYQTTVFACMKQIRVRVHTKEIFTHLQLPSTLLAGASMHIHGDKCGKTRCCITKATLVQISQCSSAVLTFLFTEHSATVICIMGSVSIEAHAVLMPHRHPAQQQQHSQHPLYASVHSSLATATLLIDCTLLQCTSTRLSLGRNMSLIIA